VWLGGTSLKVTVHGSVVAVIVAGAVLVVVTVVMVASAVLVAVMVVVFVKVGTGVPVAHWGCMKVICRPANRVLLHELKVARSAGPRKPCEALAPPDTTAP
jgi:hypothetical protein